jgi:RNA polymerase-binding transcription factor DksA
MAAPKKSPATKQAVKSVPARKPAAAKPAAAKTVATRTSAANKGAASKPAAAKKTPANKTPAKKTPAKQVPSQPVPSKQAATTTTKKKAAAAKVTAPKATPKTAPKTTATKAAPQVRAKASATTAPATTAPAKKVAAVSKTVAKPASRTGSASSRQPLVRTPSPDTPALLSNYRPDRHEIPPPRGTSKDGITYTKDFDVKFLKVQRDDLIERRRSELARATRLEDEATSLIEDGEMGDVQFDDEGGEGDTMVVQRDLDRVLSTQARQTIDEIDAALLRIEAGTYGYSEVSGLPIPRERLEALPETTVLAAEKVSGIGSR